MVMSNGSLITKDFYKKIMIQELNTIKDMYGEDNYNNRKFGMASEMFMEMITGEVLDEFLTLPAYRHI